MKFLQNWKWQLCFIALLIFLTHAATGTIFLIAWLLLLLNALVVLIDSSLYRKDTGTAIRMRQFFFALISICGFVYGIFCM